MRVRHDEVLTDQRTRFMSEDTKIDRREAMKSVAVGVGAVTGLPILKDVAFAQGHKHHVTAPMVLQAASSVPTFFNKHQYATITELASLIIPSDETPGAREASVNEYIDMIVGEAAFDVQKVYLDGLAWLDKTSQERHQKSFVDLTQQQQVAILTEISKVRSPSAPNEPQARFFKAIKDATIDGFYTSKIGIEELGYQGNTVLDEFPGCTHPEHHA
jgi:gluconate 2-dehydrogenase gamma chain